VHNFYTYDHGSAVGFVVIVSAKHYYKRLIQPSCL